MEVYIMDKGKYEIFQVGDEKVISNSREKIKEYAKKKGIEKIEYKMSVENIENIGDEYIKLFDYGVCQLSCRI